MLAFANPHAVHQAVPLSRFQASTAGADVQSPCTFAANQIASESAQGHGSAAVLASGALAVSVLAGHRRRRARTQGAQGRPSAQRVAAAAAPALLCDCDGTLVETERDGHRVGFNQAFKQLGYKCEWDVELYGELLKTGGGKERMTRYFKDFNPGAWPHAEPPAKDHPAIMELHKVKTGLFMEIVESGTLPLREGIPELLKAAKDAGWIISVCSTSNEKAVQTVVNTALPEFAETTRVFAGDCVKAKKPDPAIYNLAAKELGLDPAKCVVVEDTNIGLRAGKAAGMSVLVTRSIYSEDEDFTGADFNVRSAEDIDFAKDLVPLVEKSPAPA